MINNMELLISFYFAKSYLKSENNIKRNKKQSNNETSKWSYSNKYNLKKIIIHLVILIIF